MHGKPRQPARHLQHDQVYDAGDASSGRFGPGRQASYDTWDGFVEWAAR